MSEENVSMNLIGIKVKKKTNWQVVTLWIESKYKYKSLIFMNQIFVWLKNGRKDTTPKRNLLWCSLMYIAA